MSLINQMLKDLEARRSQQGAKQQEVLLDVQAVPEEESRPWRRTLLMAGLTGVLFSGFGWWGYRALQPIPAVSYAAAPVLCPTAETSRVIVPPPPAPAVTPAPPVAPVVLKLESRVVKSVMPVASEVTVPTTMEPPAVVEPPTVVAVTKVDRPLSSREQAEAAFQRAQTAERGGERVTMERELRQALEQDPSHLLARETLSAHLYRAGRLDEAKEVLRGGMTETSGPISLRKIMARILLDQGDAEGAAMALVQGGTPQVALDIEFHQLLAAIYQRTGQFVAAAQTYRALLEVQRKNGVWWLGLGLALESGRSLPEAKQAYKRALEDQALPSGLGDFVRNRLTALITEGGS